MPRTTPSRAAPRPPRATQRAGKVYQDVVLVGLARVATVADSVRELAKAQAPDEEIQAVAQAAGWDIDTTAPGWQLWIAMARLAGQTELRGSLWGMATGRTPASPGQAATATWMARQYLGHTAEGVDASVRSKVLRLQKLPRRELIRALREALAQLEGPPSLPPQSQASPAP